MKQVSVRLSDDEGETLEHLAETDGRSVANYTRRVIQQHLATVTGSFVQADR